RSHERGSARRRLQAGDASRKSIAVRERVDVARRHRAVDVERDIELSRDGNGERDGIAGDASAGRERGDRRTAESERDWRGGKLASGAGERHGGRMEGERAIACLEADPKPSAAAPNGNLGAVRRPGRGGNRHIERLVESRLEDIGDGLRARRGNEGDRQRAGKEPVSGAQGSFELSVPHERSRCWDEARGSPRGVSNTNIPGRRVAAPNKEDRRRSL